MNGDAREDILASVYAADVDLRDLAVQLDVGLAQLAAMASDRALSGAIESLAALAEQRARLLVARYRVNAAARLVALAGQDDDAELSRKAAVDLLKLNGGPGAGAGAAVAGDGAALDTPAVLEALAAIGRTHPVDPTGGGGR